MRSFLIRDILSGAGGGGTAAEPGNGSVNEQQARSQSSSSFDLAATQARFLAKLAENQQQVQASKYYEHLQQQHQQLLNLNLNLGQHHLQLQLQQQLKQHQQLQHQFLNQPSGPSEHESSTSCSGSIAKGSKVKAEDLLSNISGAKLGRKKEKTSSFAYDCASPISSISDVNHDDEDDEHCEEEDDDDDEDANEADADNGEEDVDIEVEIEKDSFDSGVRQSSSHSRRLNQQSSRNLRLANEADEGGEKSRVEHADSSSRVSNSLQQQEQLFGKQQLQAPFQLNSPLDALFQMTSSTFDALKRGEKRKDRDSEHHGSTNFTSKQNSKKKRKSRTAFTNPQIFELERRFRIQKYLSPTDRDEIAMTLNLSNAQVITWFQNRRAKLKRDLEEQKRDIETASLLSLHNTLVAYSQMKTAIKANDVMYRTGGNNQQDERDITTNHQMN